MRVLVMGATGMLGNTMVRYLSLNTRYEIFGTVRGSVDVKFQHSLPDVKLVGNCDATSLSSLLEVFRKTKPDAVINCIGLIKQKSSSDSVLASAPINSLLPHKLAELCNLVEARLIHFSTDCVFSGKVGLYKEDDLPDAVDVYGRTKLLGEVEGENIITLRTSIIGHEIRGHSSLVNWFLSQSGSIKGYQKAVFSGLPTCEMARIVDKYALSQNKLSGLYHVSATPISKYNLLQLIADVYNHDVTIVPDEGVVIDRSLVSDRFKVATGYKPPSWHDLILQMHKFK